MNARVASAMIASVSLGASACAGVAEYHPRAAQIGTPSQPPARLESVTTADSQPLPGTHRPGISLGSYTRPVVTREGLQDGEEVQDAEARGISIAVRIQTSQPAEIADMTWTTPDEPPCSGGHRPQRVSVMSIDGEVHWERPLVITGEHVVSRRFDEDRPMLEKPSVVDIVFVEQKERRQQTCVRVPATAADASFSEDKHWSLGSRLSLRSSLPFMAAAAFGIGTSVGRWVGPVRLAVEFSVGGTNDAPNPANSVFLQAPAIEVSGIAWRGYRLAIGWSASYELLFADLHRTPPGGGPRIDSHAFSGGPRLGLQLLDTPPWILGVPRWNARTYAGVELFAAAAGVAPRGPGGGSDLALGLSLIVRI